MYLIQQVTKQSTGEILGFFYDFGRQIFIQGCITMSGRSIRKDIKAFYPGTAIPFRILVTGRRVSHEWNPITNTYITKDSYSGTLEVMFPNNATYMNTEKLMETIFEGQVFGGCTLPEFEAPKCKTPKMYKSFIEKILKGDKTDE